MAESIEFLFMLRMVAWSCFHRWQADWGFAAQVAGQLLLSRFVGFVVLWPWWPHCVCVPYNGYGKSMSTYVRNPFASLKWLSCLGCLQKWVLRRSVFSSGLSGFVILAGLFGFILAGTYIRRNSYMMDNFGQQKFNSDWQFCASHTHTDTQTHRHTDGHTDGHTLNLYLLTSSELSNNKPTIWSWGKRKS